MENIVESIKEKFNINLMLKIFFVITIIGFAIYLMLVVIFSCFKPELLSAITATTLFSDFAETLSFVLCPNPYNGEYGFTAIYPPISFLIFYPFTLFCRNELSAFCAGEIELGELSANPGFITSYILYYLLNLTIILVTIAKFSKFRGINLFYLLSIIFCFGPLLFEFMRANNTLTTCTLLLLFFYFISINKSWCREISYVFIAGAVCMKIYPIIILSFLVWRNKGIEKLWGIIKVFLYIAILFFVPFLFIQNGFANVSILLQNALSFSSGDAVIWNSNVSIYTDIYQISNFLSFIFPGLDLTIFIVILSGILRYSLIGFAIILPFISFKAKKCKEIITLCIATYLLFPTISNGYCLIVMIIPFIAMIMDWKNMKYWEKIFYFICYNLIACPIFFTYNNFFVSSISVLALVIKSIVDIIKEDIKIYKLNKGQYLRNKTNFD